MLGEALLDLARLLVGVDVQRQALGRGVAADLLEPVRRTGADGVGGDADPQASAAQLLDLRQVVGRRPLAEPGKAAARVGGQEQGQLDRSLVRGVGRGERLLEAEVVELAHGRVTGCTHLGVRPDVRRAHRVRRLPLGLGEHHVAPGPEVTALGASPQRPLEGVRVRVHEPRQRQ